MFFFHKKSVRSHFIGGGASVLAGLSHLVIQTMAHISLLPHAIFFAVFGALQIWWGINFFRSKGDSSCNHEVGVALNGGFLGMWITTRFLPAPFIGSPEPFTIIGWTVAILEIIALLSIFQVKSRLHEHWKHLCGEAALILALMTTMTFVLYAGGQVGAELFPQFASSHDHGSHHGSMNESMTHCSSSKEETCPMEPPSQSHDQSESLETDEESVHNH